MSDVKVRNEIRLYEKDGVKVGGFMDAPPPLVVSSHFQRDFVQIELNGSRIAVVARDLERAIQNATNT
jgi:hypothetical protein